MAQILSEMKKEGSAVFVAEDAKGRFYGMASVSYLPWDSGHFKAGCVKFSFLHANLPGPPLLKGGNKGGITKGGEGELKQGKGGGVSKEYEIKMSLLQHATEFCRQKKYKFISGWIPAGDLTSVHALEETGFRLQTTELLFAWDRNDAPALKKFTKRSPCKVRSFRREDLPHLLKLAKYFSTNRFVADRQLSKSKALGVYRSWIQNACNNTFSGSDEVLVGEKGGKPVAFTTAYVDHSTKLYFGFSVGIPGLVAVHPDYRKLGINPFMISSAILSLLGKSSVVSAPSHITNFAMMHSESKTGAKPVASSYVFHKHLERMTE